MLPFAYYLLKVIICSGVLYGYYFLVLRNKIFHRWNRFYLLATLALSLLLPFIKINISPETTDLSPGALKLFRVVDSSDTLVYDYARNNHGFHFTSELLLALSYAAVCAFMLGLMLHTIIKIQQLLKTYPCRNHQGVTLINTPGAKGTPFSFFRFIFWNDHIDLNSTTGNHIFRHELAHVQEKHSHDKIFINLLLVFCWCNPFYWLIRKELGMIHEFIADQIAIEDQDTAAFASMILTSVYPGQQFNLTNNFFHAPLKRRLMMLTKNNNPKFNYLSRLMVLPLATLLFLAFTLKTTPSEADIANRYKGNKLVVMIDAGHGGTDYGAIAPDGTLEKTLTLAIAKKIEALNKNNDFEIILSRNSDITLPIKDRGILINEKKPDLLITIHIDAISGKKPQNQNESGMSVWVSNRRGDNEKSIALANTLINTFSSSYKIIPAIQKREVGIYMLDKPACPSTLIECGYLTDPADLAWLKKETNQELIARNILKAIDRYEADGLKNKASGFTIKTDTVPQAHNFYIDATKSDTNYAKSGQSILALVIVNGKEMGNLGQNWVNTHMMEYDSIRQMNAVNGKKLYGEKGKYGVIFLSSNRYKNTSTTVVHLRTKQTINPLYVIDGVIKGSDTSVLKNLSPNDIQSINVLKGESAVKLYGDAGANGVIQIITKKAGDQTPPATNFQLKNDVPPSVKEEKVFTRVEKESSFPGGVDAWTAYIQKKISENIEPLVKENKTGTCMIRFKVGIDGSTSDIAATTMQGSKLAEIAVAAIAKGPKWNPAIQNNRIVASIRMQPVTFNISN